MHLMIHIFKVVLRQVAVSRVVVYFLAERCTQTCHHRSQCDRQHAESRDPCK
jgi:hypothetical protein